MAGICFFMHRLRVIWSKTAKHVRKKGGFPKIHFPLSNPLSRDYILKNMREIETFYEIKLVGDVIYFYFLQSGYVASTHRFLVISETPKKETFRDTPGSKATSVHLLTSPNKVTKPKILFQTFPSIPFHT